MSGINSGTFFFNPSVNPLTHSRIPHKPHLTIFVSGLSAVLLMVSLSKNAFCLLAAICAFPSILISNFCISGYFWYMVSISSPCEKLAPRSPITSSGKWLSSGYFLFMVCISSQLEKLAHRLPIRFCKSGVIGFGGACTTGICVGWACCVGSLYAIACAKSEVGCGVVACCNIQGIQDFCGVHNATCPPLRGAFLSWGVVWSPIAILSSRVLLINWIVVWVIWLVCSSHI